MYYNNVFNNIIYKVLILKSILCFRLNNENELSLKLYLICLNIQKNVYLANNDNGNWITQSNFETLKKALHNNDENVCKKK